MEKKTIGGFIATLRKANGMTQKEFAERLNVSDKTVSRWERDEGAPDLAIIPVIAEIFDVTCDELLRGERKSLSEREDIIGESENSLKGEKQRKFLLKSTLSQYTNKTYIVMGISVIGLLVALICNLAFLKAVLGFFLGAILFATSIVLQAVLINKAFFSVEDAGLDVNVLSNYKKKVIDLAEKSFGLTAAFIGFTLPLILVDAYVGLSSSSLLMWGLIGAIFFIIIYAVALYFINASLLRKKIYTLNEKETNIYCYNHDLKRKCAVVLVILIIITSICHHFAISIWGPYSIMEGTTFNDYESFIAYMEQNIPYEYSSYENSFNEPVPSQDEEVIADSTIYYDENGNEISEEEFNHRTLEDINGKVVCEYNERNKSVISTSYVRKDGTVLPITVYTQDNLDVANQKASIRHVLFGGVYCLETIAVVLGYFKKRAK